MKIQESAENYLESILKLSEQMPRVRSIDITINANGSIELTDKGYEIASKTYDKEKLITKLLTSFGVSHEQAQIDACRIEHIISEESVHCIKRYLKEEN